MLVHAPRRGCSCIYCAARTGPGKHSNQATLACLWNVKIVNVPCSDSLMTLPLLLPPCHRSISSPHFSGLFLVLQCMLRVPTSSSKLRTVAQDLELPADSTPTAAAAAASMYVVPTAGPPPRQRWVQTCHLAPELAAAGDFDAAFRLLHRYGHGAGSCVSVSSSTGQELLLQETVMQHTDMFPDHT